MLDRILIGLLLSYLRDNNELDSTVTLDGKNYWVEGPDRNELIEKIISDLEKQYI